MKEIGEGTLRPDLFKLIFLIWPLIVTTDKAISRQPLTLDLKQHYVETGIFGITFRFFSAKPQESCSSETLFFSITYTVHNRHAVCYLHIGYLSHFCTTYSSSNTDGGGCHARCRSAHQEQFGELNQQPSDSKTLALLLSHSHPNYFCSQSPNQNKSKWNHGSCCLHCQRCKCVRTVQLSEQTVGSISPE